MPVALRSFLAVAVLAGCNDQKLGVVSEPPAVTITSPSEGSSLYEGATTSFQALAETFDGTDLNTLTHSWVTGSTTMCASASFDAEGIGTCDYAFPADGSHTVTVTALDPAGNRATATISIEVLDNEAPSIELTDPADGSSYAPTDLIVFRALVSDAEDSPEDLVVTASSNVDGDLGLSATPTSSGEYTAATSLSAGAHLVTFTVTDTAGRTDQDTLTLSINQAPSAPGVDISPDPAPSGYALTASVVTASVDPEGDAITYRYDWYRDGTLYQSSSNPTVTSGVTVRDEYWEVSVAPNDGTSDGNPGTAGIVIDNSPPSISSVNITPTTPYADDDLTAVPSGWFDQDGDAETYDYAWYLNGSLVGSETTSVFPQSRTERGDEVQVAVTPYDRFEDGDVVWSPTITIENSPPSTPTISISPAAPQPSDSLSCAVSTASTDADGDSISYAYAWYKDGVLTSITSSVVSYTYTAHGEVWTCEVTPDDGYDEGTPATASVTVNDTAAPSAPVVDTPYRYQNDDELVLSGTCEASCALVFYCSDSSTSWSETDTCSSAGDFEHSTTLTRGTDTACYATCTDSAGNTSSNSNTVTTQACDPYDSYEDDAGYGDSAAASIDEWSSINDKGTTTISIEGNILAGDSADWYVISATDSLADDLSAGLDYFNFEVTMVDGSSTYNMRVYAGGTDATDMECSTKYGSSGVTEYSDFNEDVGDGSHAIPSDTRSCGSGSSTRNDCADDSKDYTIEVRRNSSTVSSCQHYTLEITNGVW
jgi:hypothetical protein